MNIQAGTEKMTAPEPGGKSEWSRRRWLMFIILVLAVHVALIFMFGWQKPMAPRAVTNVPTLRLASGESEWLSLDDPSLFALPHIEGFAGFWLTPQHLVFHRIEWTEPPRWLQFSGDELATVFNKFMQTNHFASLQLELKPQPELSAPPNVPSEPLPTNSTLQIEGNLTKRPLLMPVTLPSLPANDIIEPSCVQVVVDAAGHVASVALIASSGLDDADALALKLARAMRFMPLPQGDGITGNPAARLTFGQLIFCWHTIPFVTAKPPAHSP